MPLHDWSKVDSGLYHHFHQDWVVEIGRALNRGALPDNLAALVEQHKEQRIPDVVTVELTAAEESGAGSGGIATLERPRTRVLRRSEGSLYADKASRIVIRHKLGRIVAFIEIVSPGNKDRRLALDEFVDKVTESLDQGIHVLVVDPFPPSPRDPFGMHKAVWDRVVEEEFELVSPQDRTLSSYEAETRGAYKAYVEMVGVGDPLPDMPLFIAPGMHVPVPLESTYQASWQGSPAALRRHVAG